MLSRTVRVVLCLLVATCLSISLPKTPAQAQVTIHKIDLSSFPDKIASPAAVIYSQPPSPSGGLIPSSRWDPDGNELDQWVWDNFTLVVTDVITGIQWRGGFDPTFFGSGGPVIDFAIDICASIPGGSQPDVVNPPLVEYSTGGNANQTLAGTFGGIVMYDYQFTFPTGFQATAGTKYWVQIEAWQHGIPDWGIAKGTRGNGYYFRKIHSPTSGYIYQTMQGDTAFALFGPPVTVFTIGLPLLLR